MGYPQKILPNYTYDDYVHWEGRWEIIDGLPFAMSPLPQPKHQRIISVLHFLFVKAIKKGVCKKCHAYDPLDYKVAENTIVQPDILIVCDEIKKPYLDFPPALVVEVLSPSTALRDRHTKFDIYEAEGVKYYLIVDSEREFIEVYELVNGKYVRIEIIPNKSTGFTFDDDCKVTVNFDEVWE
jgi:Uma2 family endonuclease